MRATFLPRVGTVLLVVAALSGPATIACDPPETLDPLPFEPAGPDAAPDPSTVGPFPVGVRTVTFEDGTRDAPATYEGKRSLTCEIWYPAVEDARLPDASDPRGTKYVIYDSLPESQREGLAPQDLGTLETIAVRDAAPRGDRGKFPVVFFSHGKGGIRMQSTFYTVLLASHGYVVISPDHQGDTINDLLEAGDVDVTSTAEAYADRPLDMIFLMTEMDRIILEATDPLAPVLDMQRIGVTGHSFGALTSMIVGGQNVGVDVVVAQTPAGIGLVDGVTDVPLEEYGIPVMIQSAGEDQILPPELNAQSLWDHMVTPRAWLQLDRGGHFTYSDLCIFDVEAIDAAIDLDASNVLEDGCGPENIPPEVAFPMINNAAIGFFNRHLRESTGSDAFLTDERLEELGPGEGRILQ
jgi:predicted dienelactone hydrolase